MMRRRGAYGLGRLGQVTLEYGVVTICAVLALTALQRYIRARATGSFVRPAQQMAGDANYYDFTSTVGSTNRSAGGTGTTTVTVKEYKDGNITLTSAHDGGEQATYELHESMPGS